MSDKIDCEPLEKEKEKNIEVSSPTSSEAAVSNGLEITKEEDNSGTRKVPEEAKEEELTSSVSSPTGLAKPARRSISRKSSLNKEPESTDKMTNKDVTLNPVQRTRMRSRSKSSNSEDMKPIKDIVSSEKKKSQDSSEKNTASVKSRSNSRDAAPGTNQIQSAEVKEEEQDNESKPNSVEAMNLDDARCDENLQDCGTSEPISTPMIVEDDNSSDFPGFDTSEDKYSAFSVVLRPYEETPVAIKTKAGSQNGPLIVKHASNALRTPPVRSSPSSRIDINDVAFLKPFDYGWRRELVFRSTSENSLKRNADVYYYTPLNKKVRSLREVLEHLIPGEGLSAENFTFCKESLGVNDPEKEVIREAKWKQDKNRTDEGFYTLPVRKNTPKAKAKNTHSTVPPKQKEKKEIIKDIDFSPASSPSTSTSSPLTPRIVMKTTSGLKLNSKRVNLKVEKRRKAAGPDDSSLLESIDDWCAQPKAQSNGLKRGGSDTGSGSDASPPVKMSAVSPKSTPFVKAVGVPKPAPKVSPAPKPSGAKSPAQAQQSLTTSQPTPVTISHTTDIMNLFNAGYIGLLHAFQYLKVHELLRAACVCKMWRHMATHRSLWETVKMKNSRVRNWDGFGRSLRTNGTKCLDLKKMLVPEGSEGVNEMWKNLVEALKTVPSLTKIDMGRCSPENLEMVTKACPQLESIYALSIRGQALNLGIFKGDKLVELKLKSVGGMDLTNFSALKELTNLTHLSLTSVKILTGLENALPTSLESLELGECCQMSESFATDTLPKLVNLKRLRLEKGQNPSCPTTQIITSISGLEKLAQLELINFDIKPGFDKALAKCAHVKTLLIIPTYVTQSATTNHVVMGGVTKLAATLEYFIWGLTLELLRVTDLFIDQVEGQKQKQPQTKKGAGDSIPILKPLSDENAEVSREGQTTSQVDILALPKLQRVLSTLLPTTRIKILKVPFSATWRQTIH